MIMKNQEIIEIIKKAVDKTGIKNKDIAAIAKLSASQYCNMMAGKNKKGIAFDALIRIIDKILEDRKEELVGLYVEQLEKDEYFKQAMQYANYHRLSDLQEKITNNPASSKGKLKDWIEFYNVLHKKHKEEISDQELLNVIGNMKLEDKELIFLRKMENLRANYFISNYSFAQQMIEDLQISLDEVEDEFIKEYITADFLALKGYIELYDGNEKKSRTCLKELISTSNDPSKIAHANHAIGLSYLYDNYEKSMDHLSLAYGYFSSKNDSKEMKNVRKSINLLKNLNGKVVDDSEVADELAYVFNCIAKKDTNLAKKVLKSINLDGYNSIDKGYYWYLMGVVYNSSEFLFKSAELIKSKNDKFYLKMPCLKMKEFGESEFLVSAIYGKAI